MTWTIDPDAATATHISGLVVRFLAVPGDAAAFDGTPDMPLPSGLSFTALPRLMREAGDAFVAARAARHEEQK